MAIYQLIDKMPTVARLTACARITPLFRCHVGDGVQIGDSWDSHDWDFMLRTESRVIDSENAADKNSMPSTARSLGCRNSVHRIFSRFTNVFGFPFAKDKSALQHAIVFEYDYSGLEISNGASPLFQELIDKNCLEMADHPWVVRLLNHKWRKFGRQRFMLSAFIYVSFLVTLMVSITLQLGDSVDTFGFTGKYTGQKYYGNSETYGIDKFYVKAEEFEYFIDYTAGVVGDADPRWIYNYDFLRRLSNSINGVLAGLLLITELHEMVEASFIPSEYLKDMWNTVDCLVCFLTLGVHLSSIYGPILMTQNPYTLDKLFLTLLAPLSWWKLLKFARASSTIGPFVRIILKMGLDVAMFLLVFCIFLVGFASAFFILQPVGYTTWISSILRLFEMSLGGHIEDFDVEMSKMSGYVGLIMFVLYNIISPVVLINLMIAMMGKTYDNVWELKYKNWLLEWAGVIFGIQNEVQDATYTKKYWTEKIYVVEEEICIRGIPTKEYDSGSKCFRSEIMKPANQNLDNTKLYDEKVVDTIVKSSPRVQAALLSSLSSQ